MSILEPFPSVWATAQRAMIADLDHPRRSRVIIAACLLGATGPAAALAAAAASGAAAEAIAPGQGAGVANAVAVAAAALMGRAVFTGSPAPQASSSSPSQDG